MMPTEVRQHPDGRVAVKSTLPTDDFAWMVVDPANGGAWARDIDVADWPAMTAASEDPTS